MKPGPKPRPPHKRQASQLQVRINARDKAALAAAADRAGLTLSAWAKQLLLRAARRQAKQRDPKR
jgi:predicted HicB family RNase H-like nuclease